MKLELVTEQTTPELVALSNLSDVAYTIPDYAGINATDTHFLIRNKDESAVGFSSIGATDWISRTCWIFGYVVPGARGDLAGVKSCFNKLIRYCWERLNMRKIYASAYDVRMGGFLMTMDFEEEGVLLRDKYHYGIYMDKKIFGLFRGEE